MKLQYKIALLIFGIGSLLLVSVVSVYYFYNRSNYLQDLHVNLLDKAVERATHVEINLRERSRIAVAFSNTPMITEALSRSNAGFVEMTEEERTKEIVRLNKNWMKAADASDPFIRSYMNNPVAVYLKEHMKRNPGEYGEIFLTNRYGSIIATTGKLTTLAHAHKYWWHAAFAEGKGRIFFDDRGFDASVEGYVIGVTVPIMKDGEIIGILKCNVNIAGALLDTVQKLKLGETGRLKIARSGGRIVLEKEKEPLSTTAAPVLVEWMKNRDTGTVDIEDRGEKLLTAYAPISITSGSAEYGFGGKGESIDHIMGNRGELWYVLISQELKEALSPLRNRLREDIYVAFLTMLLLGVISIFFGRSLAQPVMKMERLARRVGEGDFDVEMDVRSEDELGHLAESFNSMTKSLRETTTSLDLLGREVEERKRVEKSLRSLEKAIETMQLGVTICDTKGEIVYTNPADARMHGYEVDELIGKDASLFAPSEMRRPMVLEEIREASNLVRESVNIRKDGSTFFVHLISDIVTGASGEPVGIVTACEDITARKRAEEALRKSEERFRLLIEECPAGIGIAREGKVVYVNNSYLNMFGYDKLADLEGRLLLDNIAPQCRQEISERVKNRAGGKTVPNAYETIGLKKDGTQFPFYADVALMQLSDGLASVAFLTDLTERKRIDEELESSREQLRNLALHLQTAREGERVRIARDIHDELGQILSVFKLDLLWINKRLRSDQKPISGKIEEVSEMVDSAIDSVQRISSELRPTLLDDVGLVAGMEWQAGEFSKRTGIECNVSVEPEEIALDENMSVDIFRIFQEALTNVVRHAEATRIDVSLKVENDRLDLEIQDNGRGIEEKDVSGSKSFGLMGMRERVYSWGGELRISGAQGKGTTLIVSVPIDEKGGS